MEQNFSLSTSSFITPDPSSSIKYLKITSTLLVLDPLKFKGYFDCHVFYLHLHPLRSYQSDIKWPCRSVYHTSIFLDPLQFINSYVMATSLSTPTFICLDLNHLTEYLMAMSVHTSSHISFDPGILIDTVFDNHLCHSLTPISP